MKASPLVMIVDGDEIHREMLENMLEDDVDVVTIDNASVCLESIQYKVPDLIVIDPKDPGIDGWNLITRIRDTLEESAASIIVLTEEHNFGMRLKAYEVGANDFLAKPFQPEEFLNKVHLNLNSKQYYRRLKEEAQEAMATAMAALKQSSDLGLILHCMEDIIKAKNNQELADTLKHALSQLEIDIALMILNEDRAHYFFCTDGSPESVLMAMCRDKGRIVDIGLTTVINSADLSILIREMPKDEGRYGEIKDAVSIISNLASDRVRSLINAAELKKEQQFGLQASVLRGVDKISQMQRQIEGHAEQVNQGMSGLKSKIAESLLAIGATEEQESMVIEMLEDYLEGLEDAFIGIIKLESDLKNLTTELTNMVGE